MSRKDALIVILVNYPDKTYQWADKELKRAEENLDGEVQNYAELITNAFDLTQ